MRTERAVAAAYPPAAASTPPLNCGKNQENFFEGSLLHHACAPSASPCARRSCAAEHAAAGSTVHGPIVVLRPPGAAFNRAGRRTGRLGRHEDRAWHPQGRPLPELFRQAQELIARTEGGGGGCGGGGEATQDSARQALELLGRCDAAVEHLALFSRCGAGHLQCLAHLHCVSCRAFSCDLGSSPF